MERLTKKFMDGYLLQMMPISPFLDISEINKFHEVRREYEANTIKLGEYEDAEEQGLLIKLPKDTDKGFISYIYQGSIYVVKIEHIGHVISKRKVLKFYHDFDEAEQALKGSV